MIFGVYCALMVAWVGVNVLLMLDHALRYDHVQHQKWQAGELWFYGDWMFREDSPWR